MAGRTVFVAGGIVLLLAVILIATRFVGGGGESPAGGGAEGRAGAQNAGGVDGGPSSKSGGRDLSPRTKVPERPEMTNLVDRARYTEVQAKARIWIGRALQDGDPEARSAVMREILAALKGTDEVMAFAALEALLALTDVPFDRTGLREAVLPHLEATDGKMRRAAWYALVNTEIKPGDEALALGLLNDEDPEIRTSAAHLLKLVSKGDLTGPAGDAVVALLLDEDAGMRRAVLRGIEGASYSPELEARIIALSRAEHRQQKHEVVHFALTTQANKSAATVARLIEMLDDKDVVNVASRAAWGLKNGVSDEQGPAIAEAGLNLLEGSESPQLQVVGLDLLSTYADSSLKPQIERMAQDPNLSARLRMGLDKLYQGL